jgi:hypothetical protein
MQRSIAFHLLAALILATLSGCKTERRPAPIDRQITVRGEGAPQFGTTDSRPGVSFWNTADFQNGQPARLLFAAWDDGRVVRNVAGRLYAGRVSVDQIRLLYDRFASAGVENSPISRGMVYDGFPAQLLYLDYGTMQIGLLHDSSVGRDDLDSLVAAGTPQRAQAEAFLEMWSHAVAAMDEVWPTRLDQVLSVPGVYFPG